MKAVILNGNDLLTPLYDCFEQAEISDIVKPDKKVKAVITWNDILPDHKMICVEANKNKILTFVVQHGRGAMRDYLWSPNGEQVHVPIANAAFVWGEQDKLDAIAGGWKPESVFRVGAPWFAYKPTYRPEKNLVIFDAVHWQGEVEENYRGWDALKQIPGIHPVAKLLKSHDSKMFPGDWVMTDRNETGHIDTTYKILSNARVVVCMMEGTLELMAYSLGIPVIFLKGFRHRKLEGTYQGVEDTKPSYSTISATYKTLAKALTLAFKRPKKLLDNQKKELLLRAGDPEKDTPIQTMQRVIMETVRVYEEGKNKA